MKSLWSIIISLLLLALIVVTLMHNKKEIELKVEYAEKKIAVIPVRTTRLQAGYFTNDLKFTGIIRPISSIYVNAAVQGEIEQIFPEVGERVNQQTTLIKVDDKYLQAEYKIDQQNYELAQRNLKRIESLKDENAVTGQQLDQLENQAQSSEIKKGITEKRLNETWVKAPIKGVINQFFVEKGALIGPTVPICEIVDISRFKISLKVAEKDVVNLHKGQKVNIIPQSNPDKIFEGKIKYISLNADFALQYTVEIELENQADWLRGGMVCDIQIQIKDDDLGKIVPKKCVINTNHKMYIYAVRKGKAVRTEVVILDENEESYKVEGDLAKDEEIIVEGQSKLSDGDPIKIITS